jgi:hypothetical protein
MKRLLRLDVVGFVTNCVKQGILAVTVEEDNREDAVDNKSLCLAGEGNGLRLFLPDPSKSRSES